MSAIALFPDDLLIQIFCLTCGSSIGDKFAVSQVSVYWRRTALNAPLLWTSMHLYSVLDRRRINLVLERSGPSALLDVQITGLSDWKLEGRDLPDAALTALLPHAARIRALALEDTSEDIWKSNIDFPALESLCVRGHEFNATELCLTAPRMRVIELAVVAPSSLSNLLSERVEVVRIERCPNVEYPELLAVLTRCVNVVHLTFHTNYRQTERAHDASLGKRSWDIPPMRMLKSLDLCLPIDDLVDVLSNIVDPNSVLPAVSAYIPWGNDALAAGDICIALLRGVGPLVAFDVEDERCINLRDGDGNVRTMKVWNAMSSWEHVWPLLAPAYGVQLTAREISLPLSLWNTYSVDLAMFPPNDLRKLRVLISWENVERYSGASGDLHGRLLTLPVLTFPSLESVEFGSLYGYGLVDLHAPLLLHILRSIAYDAERTLQVNIDAPSAQIQEFRELVEMEGSDKWRVI